MCIVSYFMLPFLASYTCQGVRYFGERTTGCCESENSQIKGAASGVKANHTVNRTHQTLMNLNEGSSIQRAAVVHKGSQKSPTKDHLYNCNVPEVTRLCNTNLTKQWHQSMFYETHCISEMTFYVKRRDATQELSKNISNKDYWKFIVPHFQRTRHVKLCRQGSFKFWECSCKMFVQTGFCCRHIYAVSKTPPCRTDADVRWQVAYSLFYSKEEEIQKSLFEKGIPGPLFLKETLEPTVDSASNIAWFEDTLMSSVRTQGTYWGLTEQNASLVVQENSRKTTSASTPIGLETIVKLFQEREDDDYLPLVTQEEKEVPIAMNLSDLSDLDYVKRHQDLDPGWARRQATTLVYDALEQIGNHPVRLCSFFTEIVAAGRNASEYTGGSQKRKRLASQGHMVGLADTEKRSDNGRYKRSYEK